MTQPIQRIGPWTALITLARLGAKRIRQQPLDTARGAAKATLSFLALPMFLAFCLISFFYALIYVLPFIGAANQRLFGVKPDHYYLVQTSPIATSGWTRWADHSFSLKQAHHVLQESQESRASFFTLDEKDRSDALESVRSLLDSENKNQQAADDALLRREGLAMLRALKSGKSLEAAAAQLSFEPAAVETTPRAAELLAMQKALNQATLLRSDAVPLVEHLIPRFFTTPEARPLHWAQVQAGGNFRLATQGLAALVIIGVVIALAGGAIALLNEELSTRQAALLQEFERQSVEKAAGSARSPSKPPRL